MAYAFIITILSGLSTLIGTILVFLKFKDKNKIIAFSLSFASGVMITVSILDLIPESISYIKNSNFLFPSLIICLICIVIGIIISQGIDKYIPKSNDKLYRVGIISMIAIMLHNIPEGIITFITSSVNIELGITLAIAIALHNIPEGISISMPIYYATGSRGRAILYTLISALSEPFGALLGYVFFARFTDNVIGYILALIGGIMIQIATYELLPTSLKYKNKRISIIGFILGVSIMIINHII